MNRRPTELTAGPTVRGFIDAQEPERRRQQALLDRRLGELARAQHLLADIESDMAAHVQSLQGDFHAVGRAASGQLGDDAQQRSLASLAKLRSGMRGLMLRRDEQREAVERLREDCTAVQFRLEAIARQTHDDKLSFQQRRTQQEGTPE